MSDTMPALDEAFERMAAASFELPNGSRAAPRRYAARGDHAHGL